MNVKFKILSLFPEAFADLLGLVQTAREQNLVSIETVALRNFGKGKHKKVDDQVFGGSDGMLLSPQVLLEAITSIKSTPGYENAKVYTLSPKGQLWSQKQAEAWSLDSVPKILICGRYAGFDQRFIAKFCEGEISIGDYILNGGEVAALAVVESVVRLIPGVLSNEQSHMQDSFSGHTHLLEAPQFTRPRQWMDLDVPEVLLSGHHENIELWKQAASLAETLLKRPDLMTEADLMRLKSLLTISPIRTGLEQTYSHQDFAKLIEAV
jgi:tRNA (guanine37-N1)-methyltransferase